MLREDATLLLTKALPQELAESLVDEYLAIRQDVVTNTLGRSSGGKFVESFAQVLQQLAKGSHDQGKKLDVDRILREAESWSQLDDGLRICGARIARSMYALRSKRNILHKGDIDPNGYDLLFLLHGAQWVLSELVRRTGASSMEEAGRLVSQIQAPACGLVEDFGDKLLVHGDMDVADEVIVLLQLAPGEPALPLLGSER